ncbi:MAG: helix-turn-helix transcriptional regulator, partial [Butyricicoccus sp.]|nr:helix-turn-helix transcriptional regulator [Butyricicoccus sp.]
IHYIEENYHEKIVLAECARQLNLSYDHFQHKFKALTGLSPKQYLTRQRLSAAKNLLLSGTLSCTEIAQRCGFSTSAQFSALFKKEFGCAPTQFQKRSQPE